jgi:hypothetical protein
LPEENDAQAFGVTTFVFATALVAEQEVDTAGISSDRVIAAFTFAGARVCWCLTALIGALIAKVGGSASDNPAAPPLGGGVAAVATGGPLIFGAGSFCIIELSSSQKGTLFFTMNDTPANFDNHDQELSVDVFETLFAAVCARALKILA